MSTVWAYAYAKPADCIRPLRILPLALIEAYVTAIDIYTELLPNAVIETMFTERGSSRFAVEGDTIRGEAAFRDGAAVRHATVTVLGPAGESLGQTQTDEKGLFRFQPQRRVDHRLVVDAGGGHAAEFTVTAAELPARLAAP